jgi:hypothetical protein
MCLNDLPGPPGGYGARNVVGTDSAMTGQDRTLPISCRPYYHENTGSRPISEVKRGKARLVLGSVTAREPLRVLTAFCCFEHLSQWPPPLP